MESPGHSGTSRTLFFIPGHSRFLQIGGNPDIATAFDGNRIKENRHFNKTLYIGDFRYFKDMSDRFNNINCKLLYTDKQVQQLYKQLLNRSNWYVEQVNQTDRTGQTAVEALRAV